MTYLTGNSIISGDFTVNGTTTTVNQTVVNVTKPLYLREIYSSLMKQL